MVWRIVGGVPLRGVTSLPGDKSIAHRALILSAIAEGTSRIEGLPDGDDVARTRDALRALGVTIDVEGQLAHVRGVGLSGLRAPASHIDCGNSGTTMRLLTGLLAGRGFEVCLDSDASLRRRPMRRLLDPLRRMGARIEAVSSPDGELHAPLRLVGGELYAAHHEIPMASAQVKGALLLAGLRAGGRTDVVEPARSRDHTERLLAWMGAPVQHVAGACAVDTSGWDGRLRALRLSLPGDLSSAAPLCVGAAALPGSDIQIVGLGANPTRTGFIDVLRAMGARLTWTTTAEPDAVEPCADLRVEGGALVATDVRGALALRCVDEVPTLCVAASRAAGTTTFADLEELRHKESDRIVAMSRRLQAMGARIEPRQDGLTVRGPNVLRGVRHEDGTDLSSDHRVAMSLAAAALLAEGESEVPGAAVRTSFPAFAAALVRLGAKLTTVKRPC